MSDAEVRFTPPVSVQAGQIQFVEACHPPLVAGEYQVGMSQVVKDSESAPVPWNSDPYASALRFAVDAPRFALEPADIHSVYPPANQAGRFGNALPHVVFTRRTLPWERTIDGAAPRLGQPYAPWMGLLLLAEDELSVPGAALPRSEVRALPVWRDGTDTLLKPEASHVLPPNLGQPQRGTPAADAWQHARARCEGQTCLAIDLDAALFKAVAPRRDDLLLLAHVRQIDTGDKEVAAVNDRGWFSLLVGNRLPQPMRRHRVLLVALEGHQDRLHDDWTPAAGQAVRLAVLGHWSFECTESNDFKAHLERVAPGPFRLPFRDYGANSMDAADIVNGALARGFTAFDHRLRHGESSVSWYRGPLVPMIYSVPGQVQQPVASVDQLLRYDPRTGLFDASYAAAWQLGRLLALQNRSFAQSLQRVRETLRTIAEQKMQEARRAARQHEAALVPQPSLASSLVQRLAGDGEAALKGSSDGGPGSAHAAARAASDVTPASLDARTLADALPSQAAAEVSSWLARLVLLYGVPYHYLVPDDRLLPENALRFFFLDPIWIQALVQGACSLGSNGYGDSVVDEALHHWAQPSEPGGTAAAAGTTSRQAAGVRDGLRWQYEAAPLPAKETLLHWPLGGVLLRSPVVAGWRGLELLAYRLVPESERAAYDTRALTAEQKKKFADEGMVPLKPLRLEQLGAGVMFAIFNGDVAQLVLRQPKEGLHFGLALADAPGGAQRYRKTLRELGWHDERGAGSLLDVAIDLSAGDLMREQPQRGVVRVAELAERMKAVLGPKQQLKDGRFTSAEFAVQMIEAAGEFTCAVEWRNA